MHPLSITYNDRTLFHLLRHFESINEGAIACLLNRGYQQQEIDTALQIPGSRFHADFAQDLKSLQQQWNLGQLISQQTFGGYLHVQLKFNPKLYPVGIGKLAVVPIADLSKLRASAVFIKKNRGMLLQHTKVGELPHTWEMILVLKPQKNYQLLITAFPGTGALPIPHTKMKEADFKASSHFWENHAFLELA